MEHDSTLADHANAPLSAGFPFNVQSADPAIILKLCEEFSRRLADSCEDAERTQNGMAGFMELLQGCDAGYDLTAGNMLALLEPVFGGLVSVCEDLCGLLNSPYWAARAASLAAQGEGAAS